MDEVIAIARFNVDSNPDQDSPHYLLGDLHRQHGDVAAALESFERARFSPTTRPINGSCGSFGRRRRQPGYRVSFRYLIRWG